MAIIERPGAVTAMGILNLVIGGLGSLCCLGTIASGGFLVFAIGQIPPPKAGEPDFKALFTDFDQAHPGVKVYLILSLVALLSLLLLLAISGIGLLKMRSWGRTLAIATAIGMIAFFVVNTAYGVLEGNKAMYALVKDMQTKQKEMAEKNKQAPPPMMPIPDDPTTSNITNIISMFVYSVYPILLIWIMMMKSVRRAFAGEPTTEVADRDAGWGDGGENE